VSFDWIVRFISVKQTNFLTDKLNCFRDGNEKADVASAKASYIARTSPLMCKNTSCFDIAVPIHLKSNKILNRRIRNIGTVETKPPLNNI